MTRGLSLVALAALLIFGPGLVRADVDRPEANAQIDDLRARIHGTIESAGGLHQLTFFAEEGTRLRIRYQREKGEDLQASLFVVAPSGRTVDVDANRVYAPETGVYAIRVRAGDGYSGRYQLDVKICAEKRMPKRRHLWLSPHGFGPAPTIDVAVPDEALRSEPDLQIELTGEAFAPGAGVTLHRGDYVIRGTVLSLSEDRLRVQFRYQRVPKGRWFVTVTNPSGATDRRRVTIWALKDLILPPGVVDGTEIWFLDFTEEFDEDLADFGLAGDDETVNALARDAVLTYAVRLLRHHFGVPVERGSPTWRGTAVSFVTERPTHLAGDRYNRLEIGGEARSGAPSDNPDLPWGYVSVDVGNERWDDVGGARGGTAAKLPTGEMLSAVTPYSTSSFVDDFLPLIDRPIGAEDAGFFGPDSAALLTDDDAIERNADIVRATERLAREIAAIAAHHAARAMGVENGDDGIMGTPDRFGEFSQDRRIAFTSAEMSLLAASARDSDLPGNSELYLARPFPMAPGQRPTLDVFSGESFDRSLNPVGGPPELRFEEFDLEVRFSSLPVGFGITIDNRLVGNPPDADPGNPGRYLRAARLIQVFVTDPLSLVRQEFRQRINLLVDLDTVPNRGTRNVAAGMNDRTRSERAR